MPSTVYSSSPRLGANRFLGLLGGVQGLFSPSQIPGLQLWMKADSLVLNDGDQVATWSDSTVNGRNVTQGTSANRPLYKTAILGGKPVVRFDGVNDSMTGTSCPLLAGDSNYTIYAVIIPASASDGGIWSQGVVASAKRAAGIQTRSTFKIRSWWYGTDLDGTANFTNGVGIVVATTYSGSARNIYRANAADGNDAPSALNIDATSHCFGNHSFTGGASYFSGDIAEVLVYDSAHNSTSRGLVVAYAQGKYGI